MTKQITKVLCLHPCLDVCAAVAQFAIFSEDRPSRLQWCLLDQHRHALARCLMELQAGARFPFTFDPAFQAYMDMVYSRLERRFGPLAGRHRQGPEKPLGR